MRPSLTTGPTARQRSAVQAESPQDMPELRGLLVALGRAPMPSTNLPALPAVRTLPPPKEP